MPAWLEHLLGSLNAITAFLGFLGSIAAAMVPILVKIRADMRRSEAAMLSVPPTPRPVVSEETLADQLEQTITDLKLARCTIDELKRDLNRAGEDQARLQSALRSSRAECSRLTARVAELEEKQRALDAGHTRLGPPHPRTPGSSPSWEPVQVVEDYAEEERPTPPQGNRRPL